MKAKSIFFFFLACGILSKVGALASSVTIASKTFTESYILGRVAALKIKSAHAGTVVWKPGMGNTGVLFESLKIGAIDFYPDYTGTLTEALLKRPELKKFEDIQQAMNEVGLTISKPLGFNNTYALAVPRKLAQEKNLKSISDLRRVESEIRAAFSYEFMNRKDGYNPMVETYRLKFPSQNVKRMEHSLVYQAVHDGAVDLVEVYSTDANIVKYDLKVLDDDLHFFPAYEAVWVARTAFVKNNPEAWQAISSLEGQISDAQMRDLNAKADIEKEDFNQVAASFLGVTVDQSELANPLLDRTIEHLRLVGWSLLFSILVGIPFGLFAAKYKYAGQAVLLVSALVQTLPSLALLVFLIPFFGIGEKPALVALCLYSLLPVVLNTSTGINNVDRQHIENAKAFGLNRWQILRYIYLPLASPVVLTGVKTATVLSIGTATLAALVGAGGYGAPIVSGLALNDTATILSGAIPAAGMALCAHLLFGGLSWALIPKGLRL